MKRQAMDRLVAWKNDSGRRPLLLRGARQVGKTWLMKEFGSQEYERTAYVRFDHASPLRDVFASETNVANLLQAVQLHVGFKVEPGKTLLVFDEIQECPGALASLKFFCEEVLALTSSRRVRSSGSPTMSGLDSPSERLTRSTCIRFRSGNSSPPRERGSSPS